MKFSHTKPLFETLEDRCLLAFNVVADHGLLSFKGTDGPDEVIIQDQGNGSFLVEQGGVGTPYDNITSMKINAKGGDDLVTFTSFTDSGIFSTALGKFQLRVELGSGNDLFDMQVGPGAVPVSADNRRIHIRMEIDGGGGDDSLNLGIERSIPTQIKADIKLEGNGGNDQVQGIIQPDPTFDGDLTIRLQGGSGNDSVTGVFSNDVDMVNNGKTRFHLDGGSGDDNVALRVAEAGALSFTNNDHFIGLVHGGTGNDLLNNLVGDSGALITNNGKMTIETKGSFGDDTIAAAIGLLGQQFTFLNNGNAHFASSGGSGKDTINANAGVNGGQGSAVFLGTVHGGLGKDTLGFLFEQTGTGKSHAKVLADRQDDLITVTALVKVLGAKPGNIVVV